MTSQHNHISTAPLRQRTGTRTETSSSARSAQHSSSRANSRGSQQGASAHQSADRSQTPQRERTFAELGVPATLVESLAREGKITAFPIQTSTLPDSLKGRDVLGRGRTGSGKTLAFSLPLVARLAATRDDGVRANVPGHPRGLVLAPTRELATQIAEVLAPLGKAEGLRVSTIFGGVKQGKQQSELKRGTDIIVACPGRLEDLMAQRIVSLADVEVSVLDEADLMADMGFLPAVTRILKATGQQGQRLLFSATLDNGVDILVKRFLHDPISHSVDPEESPVELMTHHVFEVADEDEKQALILKLASGENKRIVFFRAKHRAKRMAKKFTAAGIPSVDLQGNLSQNARDRNLGMFQSGQVRVLAATDVAARGVDVDKVALVVHADPPAEHKTYLHRSGRTARAGQTGDVVTICLPAERSGLVAVLRKAKINVVPQRVTAQSDEVAALVGTRAPYVKPVAVAEQHLSSQQKHGGKRPGRSQNPRTGEGRGRGAPSGRSRSQRSSGQSSASGASGRRSSGRAQQASRHAGAH